MRRLELLRYVLGRGLGEAETMRKDDRAQPGLMRASRITLLHFSVSSAMRSPNSVGESFWSGPQNASQLFNCRELLFGEPDGKRWVWEE